MKYRSGARYKIVNIRKRTLVRLVDVLLNSVHKFLDFPTDHTTPIDQDKAAIRRILCIRLAYLGDVVMTLPVLQALRVAFPHAQIDFITSRSAASLFDNNPIIRNVIPFDAPWFYPNSRDSVACIIPVIQKKAYDLGIDFRGDIRNIFHLLWRPGIIRRLSYVSGGGGSLLTHPVEWSGLTHKVEYHLDLLRAVGIPAVSAMPRLHLGDEERTGIRALFPELSVPPIVVHPGSRLPAKRWPVERFRDLVVRLVRAGVGPVWVVGGPGEESLVEEIRSVSPGVRGTSRPLSIREFACLCEQAILLVCHDSAPMHVAAAVGCPVVALFGPSCAAETGPVGVSNIVVEGTCVVKERCDESRCHHRNTFECMQSISVEKVYEACRTILHRN